ncbi:hypothetical protein COX84_05855 [Candidatus Micrarchaeota archaeon CG_4_10_14_0_2_um_filter_49_7]|nr:MAG: hypothetical protein COX84_05855 [Candidatus Micrarchaeota archaeon CG_4_10_14_0_2_um_filter_49_7]
MGSGALLCSIHKGLGEINLLGWVKGKVKLCGSQPIGCAPIAKAYESGGDIIPVETPASLVRSLAIGDPASGAEALKYIRETGGFADAPDDKEVIEGQKLLARTEGIFAEPAGGVAIATLKRKAESGEIGNGETVVVLITGNGLKTPEVLYGQFRKKVRTRAVLEDVEKKLKLQD